MLLAFAALSMVERIPVSTETEQKAKNVALRTGSLRVVAVGRGKECGMVALRHQFSRKDCIPDVSFGCEPHPTIPSVWTDGGCRGKFDITTTNAQNFSCGYRHSPCGKKNSAARSTCQCLIKTDTRTARAQRRDTKIELAMLAALRSTQLSYKTASRHSTQWSIASRVTSMANTTHPPGEKLSECDSLDSNCEKSLSASERGQLPVLRDKAKRSTRVNHELDARLLAVEQRLEKLMLAFSFTAHFQDAVSSWVSSS